MIWTRVTDFLLGRRVEKPDAVPAMLGGTTPVATRKPRRLPSFRGTANDSNRRSAIAHGGDDPARLKLQHAFTPSQPVNDVRMFAGRRDVLLSLIRAIEEAHLHVVIFGDRGIGKTSLVHAFSQLAREARYIVRYLSCSETSEFSPVFRAIAGDIPLLYHSDFDPTSEAAERGATLDEMLGDGIITVPDVSEAFAKLSGTRVLVILDEFDRATSADFKRSIAELIKSLSDQSIRVQIVIAGVAANLTELVEHIPSIRRNVLGLPMTGMTHEEIVELIGFGEAVSGLAFDEGAVEAIIEAAQGSPYVAGLLAQQAASATLDRKVGTVSTVDVASAIGRTLVDVKVRIPPRGQQALSRVEALGLMDEAALVARDAMRNFGVILQDVGTEPKFPAAVVRIAELGIMQPIRVGDLDGYQFVDDSIPLYLWLRSQTIGPE